MGANVLIAAIAKYGTGKWFYNYAQRLTGHWSYDEAGNPLVECSGLVWDALSSISKGSDTISF